MEPEMKVEIKTKVETKVKLENVRKLGQMSAEAKK